MIKLTETYNWQQKAVISKFDKLQVELEMVSFSIDETIENTFELSQYTAVEGMKVFAQRLDSDWDRRKDDLIDRFPKFDFEKRYRINIYETKPTGKSMSFDEFVGFDYKTKSINTQDYRGSNLAYALLEPPYGIALPTTAKSGSKEYHAEKTKEYTTLYRMFLNDFMMFSQYCKEDFVIYSWSDDWSNFFDAGKEWWGTYYWTVYNKRNNTIIVLGGSETD